MVRRHAKLSLPKKALEFLKSTGASRRRSGFCACIQRFNHLGTIRLDSMLARYYRFFGLGRFPLNLSQFLFCAVFL